MSYTDLTVTYGEYLCKPICLHEFEAYYDFMKEVFTKAGIEFTTKASAMSTLNAYLKANVNTLVLWKNNTVVGLYIGDRNHIIHFACKEGDKKAVILLTYLVMFEIQRAGKRTTFEAITKDLLSKMFNKNKYSNIKFVTSGKYEYPKKEKVRIKNLFYKMLERGSYG